jgi:hypothetical protein
MRIAASCVGTGVFVLSLFSLVRPQIRVQDAGETQVVRGQSHGQPQDQLQSQPQGVSHPNLEIYASDPDQIWNRLFRLFYVRHARNGGHYGGDELDPYLWEETKYLLSGPSHDEALKLLDEFLQQHSENLVRDPLRRAVFQRDLLGVYEWLAALSGEQKPVHPELQKRIAEVIRRLALTANEIGKLPDNYNDAILSHAFPVAYDAANANEPFLPAGLFDPTGPWVCLGEEHGRPVASRHLEFFRGRSVFLVFFQVPGGRSKTLEYLDQLRNIPKGWGPNEERPHPAGFPPVLVPYPEPPQFPIGTRMALVRQMVLSDASGHPIATHLTESVQLRVYRAIHFDLGGTGSHSQDFFEFTLSRERLFSGQAGGLRAIGQGEKEFAFFLSHGIDPFEEEEAPERFAGIGLRSCSACHEAAGMHSFLSYSRERFGPVDVPPPKLNVSTPSLETATQIQWIERQRSLRLTEEVAERVR